jgi:hypothetical protein
LVVATLESQSSQPSAETKLGQSLLDVLTPGTTDGASNSAAVDARVAV